ncbi:hypothetical protein ACFLYU_04425 [Candidatus Dependentiae bacterium]
MNYKIKYKKLFLGSVICFTNIAFGMNLINYYDTLILPVKNDCSRYQFYATGQTGFSTKSFDECECVSNVLRIWNKDQNALKMLEGFCANTKIGQLRTRLDANDDKIRGHFKVCGDLDVNFAGEIGGWFYFNKEFFVSLQLPIYSMKLKNVSWKDMTKEVSADDFRVKNYLTNNFTNNVKKLGCLDICGWKRSGIGDLAVLFGWRRDFLQEKKLLKNVRLGARAGLTLPTGKKTDEDKLFAFAFGNDGAVGALLGGGLDLTFGSCTRAGLDVQLLYPFGNTKCRRIKTHLCQTDLLFLKKVDTYKSFALTQRFNLYLEFFKKGFSFKAGYQFMRKGEDILYICSNEFSDDIANTAESLQDWTMHSIVANASYHFWSDYNDCCDCDIHGSSSCGCGSCGCGCSSGYSSDSKSFDDCDSDCEHRVHPYIGLFVKIPFNGMCVSMERTIGITFGIDF